MSSGSPPTDQGLGNHSNVVTTQAAAPVVQCPRTATLPQPIPKAVATTAGPTTSIEDTTEHALSSASTTLPANGSSSSESVTVSESVQAAIQSILNGGNGGDGTQAKGAGADALPANLLALYYGGGGGDDNTTVCLTENEDSKDIERGDPPSGPPTAVDDHRHHQNGAFPGHGPDVSIGHPPQHSSMRPPRPLHRPPSYASHPQGGDHHHSTTNGSPTIPKTTTAVTTITNSVPDPSGSQSYDCFTQAFEIKGGDGYTDDNDKGNDGKEEEEPIAYRCGGDARLPQWPHTPGATTNASRSHNEGSGNERFGIHTIDNDKGDAGEDDSSTGGSFFCQDSPQSFQGQHLHNLTQNHDYAAPSSVQAAVCAAELLVPRGGWRGPVDGDESDQYSLSGGGGGRMSLGVGGEGTSPVAAAGYLQGGVSGSAGRAGSLAVSMASHSTAYSLPPSPLPQPPPARCSQEGGGSHGESPPSSFFASPTSSTGSPYVPPPALSSLFVVRQGRRRGRDGDEEGNAEEARTDPSSQVQTEEGKRASTYKTMAADASYEIASVPKTATATATRTRRSWWASILKQSVASLFITSKSASKTTNNGLEAGPASAAQHLDVLQDQTSRPVEEREEDTNPHHHAHYEGVDDDGSGHHDKRRRTNRQRGMVVVSLKTVIAVWAAALFVGAALLIAFIVLLEHSNNSTLTTSSSDNHCVCPSITNTSTPTTILSSSLNTTNISTSINTNNTGAATTLRLPSPSWAAGSVAAAVACVSLVLVLALFLHWAVLRPLRRAVEALRLVGQWEFAEAAHRLDDDGTHRGQLTTINGKGDVKGGQGGSAGRWSSCWPRLAEVHALEHHLRRTAAAMARFSEFVPMEVLKDLATAGEDEQDNEDNNNNMDHGGRLYRTHSRVGGANGGTKSARRPVRTMMALKDLTVLFSDIEGFTALCESVPLDDLYRLLNRYFERMVAIVLLHGGTIDKFIGDAIMAFWGAPLAHEYAAFSACCCALHMQAAATATSVAAAGSDKRQSSASKPVPPPQKKTLSDAFESVGFPLRVRIGIHSGLAAVGVIGSSQRRSYTALGDVVNVAARLEGINKQYQTRLIVSGAVAHAPEAACFVFRRLGAAIVKGRSEALQLFELVGADDHAGVPQCVGIGYSVSMGPSVVASAQPSRRPSADALPVVLSYNSDGSNNPRKAQQARNSAVSRVASTTALSNAAPRLSTSMSLKEAAASRTPPSPASPGALSFVPFAQQAGLVTSGHVPNGSISRLASGHPSLVLDAPSSVHMGDNNTRTGNQFSVPSPATTSAIGAAAESAPSSTAGRSSGRRHKALHLSPDQELRACQPFLLSEALVGFVARINAAVSIGEAGCFEDGAFQLRSLIAEEDAARAVGRRGPLARLHIARSVIDQRAEAFMDAALRARTSGTTSSSHGNGMVDFTYHSPCK